MKLTRMVGVVAVGIAVLTAYVPHASGGDLWDRLFKRRQKTAREQPTVVSPQSTPRGPVSATSSSMPVIQAQYETQETASSATRESAAARETIPLLTLDEALRVAESRQPQLIAAAAAIDAARGRFRQAGTYPNPNLEVRGEQIGETQMVAGVSQPIILGDRRWRAMDAACRDIETRERELAALCARVLWEVKQPYHEVLGLQQLLALAREQERSAQTLVEKTQERFKLGDVAERDVLRAEVDLSTVRIQAENLERTLVEARKTLATRMGVSNTTIVRCAGELALPERFGSEDDLAHRLIAGHPELEAALAEAQFREAAAAQAYAERIPDVSVTMLYRKLDTGQDTADVGITLPLPFFDRRTGRIQETAADASRAHAQRAATENELLGRLRRAYESLLTYYRQSEAYQNEILPKTDRSLELVRTAYEGGDVSILELLDTQRQSNTAHAAYLDVLSKLTQKWLEVEYLVQSQPARPPSVR